MYYPKYVEHVAQRENVVEERNLSCIVNFVLMYDRAKPKKEFHHPLMLGFLDIELYFAIIMEDHYVWPN